MNKLLAHIWTMNDQSICLAQYTMLETRISSFKQVYKLLILGFNALSNKVSFQRYIRSVIIEWCRDNSCIVPLLGNSIHIRKLFLSLLTAMKTTFGRVSFSEWIIHTISDQARDELILSSQLLSRSSLHPLGKQDWWSIHSRSRNPL